MKIKLVIIALIVAIYSEAGNINIAVSANVSYAINDLKKEFNKLYPNTEVRVTLGSSGKLTAQIKHGAPYQLFMSANMQYPNTLYREKKAISEAIVYAQGTIAILSNKKRTFSNSLDILRDKKIRRIAIANPKTAPYGIATVEALKSAGIYKDIRKKFIYGESISQTISYAVTACDIGIIAKSSLFSPRMSRFKKGKNWIEIDPKLYTPINQGVVILKRGVNSPAVAAFYNFILSQKAKKIFEDFGYITL